MLCLSSLGIAVLGSPLNTCPLLTTANALGEQILPCSFLPGKCLERWRRRINVYWTSKKVSELCAKRPERVFICITSSDLHNTLVGEGGWELVRCPAQNRLRARSRDTSPAPLLSPAPTKHSNELQETRFTTSTLAPYEILFSFWFLTFSKSEITVVCFLKGGCSIKKQSKTKTKPLKCSFLCLVKCEMWVVEKKFKKCFQVCLMLLKNLEWKQL